MGNKNIKDTEIDKQKELGEEEVNGYALCYTAIKEKCLHDCPGIPEWTAWLTPAN